MYKPHGEQFTMLIKFINAFIFYPNNPISGNLSNLVYTRLYKEALFAVAKMWKQTKCP